MIDPSFPNETPSYVRPLLRAVVSHPEIDARRDAAVIADREIATDISLASPLWVGVVAGEYFCVDQFDDNGRRFVLLRRRPDHFVRTPLSIGEQAILSRVAAGAANKMIAYDLGIPEGTVASRIARTMAKLGVSRRIDLVYLVRALTHSSPAEGVTPTSAVG